MDIEIIISLVIFAFCAGAIDAAVGGGGLIQIPAIMGAMPQLAPATVFGTNKLGLHLWDCFGSLFFFTQSAAALENAGRDWTMCLSQLFRRCGLRVNDSDRYFAALCAADADRDCHLHLHEKAVWPAACAADFKPKDVAPGGVGQCADWFL